MRLIRRVRHGRRARGEVRAIDARGERMDVGVAAALRLVEAVAAGEDESARSNSSRSAAGSSGGAKRKAESSSMQSYTTARRADARENGSAWGVWYQSQGSVMPCLPMNRSSSRRCAASISVSDKPWDRYRTRDDNAFLRSPHVDALGAVRLQDRLFPEKNPLLAGGAAHQVLGSLKDKIPPEMRKTK